jgi:hypothetical protein
MTSRFGSIALLLVIALGCAAMTFYYFDNYPAFAAGTRGPPLWRAWSFVLTVLLAAAPVLWVVALVARTSAALAALETHAALLSVFLFITIVTQSAGHASPGDAFGGMIVFGLFIVFAAEVIVAVITRFGLKDASDSNHYLQLAYPCFAIPLIGGWLLGILAWSTMFPPRIASAAETAAGDRPYCIDVDGRPAQKARDLAGLSAHAHSDDGWTTNFHALLVVGAGADRTYSNWSYRSGRFEPLNERTREALHLDAQVKCAPAVHFARDWM